MEASALVEMVQVLLLRVSKLRLSSTLSALSCRTTRMLIVLSPPSRGDGFALSQLAQTLNIDFNTLQNRCCQTQRQIADFRGDLFLQNCKDTAELRNGQRDLGFAITQGFSSTAFQAQQDKCDILRAGQDNTQRIIDTLNNHWKDEQALKIQDLKFELSQERQNNLINERFNRLGNCGCGGNSCGCGCGQ